MGRIAARSTGLLSNFADHFIRNDGSQLFANFKMYFERHFISNANKFTPPISPFSMVSAKGLWEGAKRSQNEMAHVNIEAGRSSATTVLVDEVNGVLTARPEKHR